MRSVLFGIFKPGTFCHRASHRTGVACFVLENTGLGDPALAFCDLCISEYFTEQRHLRDLPLSDGVWYSQQLRNLLFSK